MVLASRRPRTVLGCLVGRVCPGGRGGLLPRVRLPRGLPGPAVPGGAFGRGCSGGSSPAAGPLAAAGHACPSPRPVAERTPLMGLFAAFQIIYSERAVVPVPPTSVPRQQEPEVFDAQRRGVVLVAGPRPAQAPAVAAGQRRGRRLHRRRRVYR